METTLDSDSKPSVDSSSRPLHWCSICSLDLQSNKSLVQHSKGRKHQKRWAEQMLLSDGSPSSQPPICIRCHICGKSLETRAQEREHLFEQHMDVTPKKALLEQPYFRCGVCGVKFSTYLAYEVHRDTSLDARHLKALYQKEGIEVDENALEEACALPAATDEMNRQHEGDVDYSRINDMARMLQTEYDDTVVELALYNYESFHSLSPGSATFTMVNGTSAGIQGWSTLGDAAHPGNSKDEIKESASDVATQLNTITSNHKGDNEEEQLLRIAMMESLLESRGVRPASCQEESEGQHQSSRRDTSIYMGDIEEESSYQYETETESDDDYESQSETSHDQSEESDCEFQLERKLTIEANSDLANARIKNAPQSDAISINEESWSNVSESEVLEQPDEELNDSNGSFSSGDEWNLIASGTFSG